jgi:hypothetical protein
VKFTETRRTEPDSGWNTREVVLLLVNANIKVQLERRLFGILSCKTEA